jgi:hypothetical protein
MTKLQVELFTDQGNNAVVRLPGRQYPGVLIQGDSLAHLVGLVREASESLIRGSREDAENALGELGPALKHALERYESAVKAHGMALPY